VERAELLRRISTFSLSSDALARDLMSGDFRSVFRGEGIEFDEVRLYEQGDDVRTIDRNVSARFGRPYVKRYREEREMTVLVILDCSASMFAGTTQSSAPPADGTAQIGGTAGFSAGISRYEQALFAAVLVAFSAERTGQRLGAILFDNAPRVVLRPRKGRVHTLAFTQAALEARPAGRGTNLSQALSGAAHLLKRRSLVFIVSDFLAVNWENELGRLAEKHDCVACRIYDPSDRVFPAVGLVTIEDPETGATITADASSRAFKAAWADYGARRAALWANLCRRGGTAHFELSTTEDAPVALKNFFKKHA
jgi:uncharacterized protein (DUF58 family)